MKWKEKSKLKKSLKNIASELKKFKMTPSQYIKISTENLKILKCKAVVQRAAAEAKSIKMKFIDCPSMKTISPKNTKDKKIPDYEITQQYFTYLYRSKDSRNSYLK